MILEFINYGCDKCKKTFTEDEIWECESEGCNFFVCPECNETGYCEEHKKERKLKEMCYGEIAFLYWGSRKNNLDNLISTEDIKSVVTGNNADRTYDKFTREEFMGKWTIEGIYEDENEQNEN